MNGYSIIFKTFINKRINETVFELKLEILCETTIVVFKSGIVLLSLNVESEIKFVFFNKLLSRIDFSDLFNRNKI